MRCRFMHAPSSAQRAAALTRASIPAWQCAIGRCALTSGAVIYLGAPRPNFLCRSTREELERECIPSSEPPTLQVTVGVNSYSHFFSRTNEKPTQNSPRSTPEAILMHNLLIVCLGYTPRPAPGSGDAHH